MVQHVITGLCAIIVNNCFCILQFVLEGVFDGYTNDDEWGYVFLTVNTWPFLLINSKRFSFKVGN